MMITIIAYLEVILSLVIFAIIIITPKKIVRA